MSQDKQDPTPPAAPPALRELRVEKLVTGGAGLARCDDGTVFIPLTAPGDLVQATVAERRRGFLRATLVAVREPGPDRTAPPCPHFGDCGGCDLQHLTPAAQRRSKTEIVADCFLRLGKLDLGDRLVPPPAGRELGYRNRIRLYADPTGHYGLRRRGSHDVVALPTGCPLLLDQFNAEIMPWLRLLPPMEQVVVRLDGRGGWLASLFGQPARHKMIKRMLAALPAGEAPAPGCLGLLFNNRPVWGRDHLIHEVAGHKFRVSAQGFFQGNGEVAAAAVDLVRAWVQEGRAAGAAGDLLGDFYCGVGLFTLALADLFARVVAVELDEGACRDAENNIQRDAAARDKAQVHAGDLPEVLARPAVAAAGDWTQATCVLDPPRTGLGKEGVQALLALRPRHVLYLSCDPATLARDVAALAAAGYAVRRAQVLDMFPQTAHVETLVHLEVDPAQQL